MRLRAVEGSGFRKRMRPSVNAALISWNMS